MKLFPRNHVRQPLPPLEINPAQPPGMLRDPADAGREIYLNWSGAMDDKGHLRRCPLCDCEEFFVRKDMPQVTAFVLVLIAAAIAVALFAADKLLSALMVLLTVAVLDVLIFFFAGRHLVCYHCRSEFAKVPIARHQKPWQADIGERYSLDDLPAAMGRPQSEAAPARQGYANLGEADFPTPISEAQGAAADDGDDDDASSSTPDRKQA